MNKLLALDLGKIGGGIGLGPWGDIANLGGGPSAASSAVVDIFSRILGVLTVVAGLWFIIQLITAAFDYINAGENEEQIRKVHQKLINNFVGLSIVVMVYALTAIIGRLVGLDILNPQRIIPGLGP